MDALRRPDARIAAVAALEQPLRRRLYDLLVERAGWVGRDDAAAALGVPRSVAAFHLDKLAALGVVEVGYERAAGRTGPGAGRPAKRYRLTADEVGASVPDRRYDLAGRLLADAVAAATEHGEPVGEALTRGARALGLEIGRSVADADDLTGRRAVIDALIEHGYRPCAGDDDVVLENCPFHRLAERHRELICGMNLDLLRGVIDGIGVSSTYRATLVPEPGRCCVRLDRV
ncbi:MAG: transcriptional regulator [Microthrixaceae bacterium]|nr:transcriptional regulator [Microthrixaceae bacterium]